MNAFNYVIPTAAVLLLSLATKPHPSTQDPARAAADMAAMMEQAARFTQPGEHHELLRRFLGSWTTRTQLFAGNQGTPPEPGEATFSWLMEGRWLKSESTGTMMGQQLNGFSIIGYDNFKMSYVITTVNSMDTAMNRWEGDLDPNTGALLLYGTLDEYLTGEHDKMVKVVFRFPADDEIVMEIHDLAIGETHTKVVEIAYARQLP